MKTRIAGIALAGILGSLCGCGAVPASHYYQLTAPTTPPLAPSASTLPVALVVAPLRGSPLYRDDRLIYATGREQMGAYEYERWAESPTLMIQQVIVRTLRASGRYRTVEALSSLSRGDFTLRGSLYDFKEISDGPLRARVTLNMDLRDNHTGAIVWTHYYTYDQPVTQETVPSVVTALDENVQQAVAQINSSLQQFLDQYVPTHPPQPQSSP